MISTYFFLFFFCRYRLVFVAFTLLVDLDRDLFSGLKSKRDYLFSRDLLNLLNLLDFYPLLLEEFLKYTLFDAIEDFFV
jgi:hypothetical protein